MMHPRPRTLLHSTILLALAVAACDQPRAHGDANAVIVAANEDLWFEVEDDFRDRMEPTIQTVRAERPFRITHADPRIEETWPQLQRFRQVLAMGTRGTPWVDEALSRSDDPDIAAPAVTTAQNVWARGQTVWIMLLPEDDPTAAVHELAGQIHERLDQQYRAYARNRMFVSGRDTILADSLAQNVGFSLVLPMVYRYRAEDTVFVFRNDNPSPSELIRQIAVTWWEPAPEEDPTREEMEAWRDELVANYYQDQQILEANIVTFEPLEVNGARGVEFQSAWVSPLDAWPAGGPFISRALRCPDQNRMYLMDAWLYAPGRDKYEYMIQLQTILDSFRCR
jgi:hypothetical protein